LRDAKRASADVPRRALLGRDVRGETRTRAATGGDRPFLGAFSGLHELPSALGDLRRDNRKQTRPFPETDGQRRMLAERVTRRDDA